MIQEVIKLDDYDNITDPKAKELVKQLKQLQSQRFDINRKRHVIIKSYQEHRSHRKSDNDMKRLKRNREQIYKKIIKLEKKLDSIIKNETRTFSI